MKKKGVFVMIDKTVLEKMKEDPITKLAGRSAFVRNAINIYYEKKELENKTDKKQNENEL